MGPTACTEPQCLYKGDLYLYLTVELYLYSAYGPYGLYRTSVPLQGCTLSLPYSRAIPLLPLWAVRPVQSLSARSGESRVGTERGLRCRSTHSWPTALEGGDGSASRSGHSLPPGKTRYPLYRRLGEPQGQFGQVWKILPPPGFDPRTIQPVASRYTDYTTQPTNIRE
jgi:hypothetical protein